MARARVEIVASAPKDAFLFFGEALKRRIELWHPGSVTRMLFSNYVGFAALARSCLSVDDVVVIEIELTVG